MQKALFILVPALLLAACSTDQTTSTTDNKPVVSTPDTASTTPDTSSTTDFQVAFSRFFEALQSTDTATLNQFIHPKYGLWIIEQPGAVPKMTHVFEIQKFGRSHQNKSFFTVAQEVQQCELTEEVFPEFSCAELNYEAGKTGYSKDGCFVWKPEKFLKSGYWNYADLSLNQVKQVQSTLPHIQKSVLHTNTSFEFHFGYLQGQWYLLFAKIIYPCSV